MPNRLPLAFIPITLLLDAIGIGLILPVLPHLISEVSGNALSAAALWGGLSDRFGRRPVLLVSTGVMALDYVVMALAVDGAVASGAYPGRHRRRHPCHCHSLNRRCVAA